MLKPSNKIDEELLDDLVHRMLTPKKIGWHELTVAVIGAAVALGWLAMILFGIWVVLKLMSFFGVI